MRSGVSVVGEDGVSVVGEGGVSVVGGVADC